MTMTQEERISKLEGAFETLSMVVANMVTKDELRASVEGTQASIDGLRGELHASVEMLRAENQATAETLRAEMRAMEVRTIRWTVGSIFASAAIVVAANSSIVLIAIRLLT